MRVRKGQFRERERERERIERLREHVRKIERRVSTEGR